MDRPFLTNDQFIAEMNTRLREHAYYREGMEFRPYPEGSSGDGMSGYSVTGPYELTGVYAAVATSVSEEFSLKA